jgi:hypothetical protein
MAIGALAGVLLTGTIVGGIALLSASTTAAAVQPDPIVAASAAPVPTLAAPFQEVDPAVPAAALSALSQSNLLNQRLVADTARLEAALSADPATSVEIARALRALSATAAFGDRIAPDVATWSDGFEVSAGLEAFYDAVGSTARDGLAFSLQNRAAYIDAGRAMLKVMAGLPALAAASRDLAATADLDLPALTGTAPAP